MARRHLIALLLLLVPTAPATWAESPNLPESCRRSVRQEKPKMTEQNASQFRRTLHEHTAASLEICKHALQQVDSDDLTLEAELTALAAQAEIRLARWARDHDEALKIARRAATVVSNLDPRPSLASIELTEALANLEIRFGKGPKETARLFDLALLQRQDLFGPNHPETAKGHSRLGNFYKPSETLTGESAPWEDGSLAEHHYVEAMRIHLAAETLDRDAMQDLLLDLSSLFRDRGETEKGDRYLDMAMNGFSELEVAELAPQTEEETEEETPPDV